MELLRQFPLDEPAELVERGEPQSPQSKPRCCDIRICRLRLGLKCGRERRALTQQGQMIGDQPADGRHIAKTSPTR